MGAPPKNRKVNAGALAPDAPGTAEEAYRSGSRKTTAEFLLLLERQQLRREPSKPQPQQNVLVGLPAARRQR